MDGRLVDHVNGISSNNLTVDLENQANGLYFFNIQTDQDYKTFKVIKY